MQEPLLKARNTKMNTRRLSFQGSAHFPFCLQSCSNSNAVCSFIHFSSCALWKTNLPASLTAKFESGDWILTNGKSGKCHICMTTLAINPLEVLSVPSFPSGVSFEAMCWRRWAQNTGRVPEWPWVTPWGRATLLMNFYCVKPLGSQ